ncbi:hypothetical protein CLCR_07834 [Cladophialophora carrionii]|uniref:Uncharacterized protein n=1 Tax=Cladophialophora carrionii TaxID=86049 RepID=A0A1C1CPC6_9EURO|nr:hypothetical protein CLCR_07834 [Cladophialophora carrionii]
MDCTAMFLTTGDTPSAALRSALLTSSPLVLLLCGVVGHHWFWRKEFSRWTSSRVSSRPSSSEQRDFAEQILLTRLVMRER